MTPLQPAGEALEALQVLNDKVPLLVAEIERKNELLRQALDSLRQTKQAFGLFDENIGPWHETRHHAPMHTHPGCSACDAVGALMRSIDAITKELTP